MPSSSTLEATGGDGRLQAAEPACVVEFQLATLDWQPEMGLKMVPPSKEISNSTVPVGATGLSDPGEEIVKPAVVVMIWPVTDGFATAVIPVAVDARFTVWATADEVEVAKFASPEYTAVIDHGLPAPTAADDEQEAATPLRPTFVEHKRTCGPSSVSWP